MTRMRGLPLLLLPLLACGGAEPPLEEPEPLDTVSPFVYPLTLWDAGLEGETMLRVLVSTSGAVDSAYVDVSSGFAEFDSAAMAGVRDIRFRPARQGTEDVEAWIKLPVRFIMDTAAAVLHATLPGAAPGAGSDADDTGGEAPEDGAASDGDSGRDGVAPVQADDADGDS